MNKLGEDYRWNDLHGRWEKKLWVAGWHSWVPLEGTVEEELKALAAKVEELRELSGVYDD